MEYDGWCQCSVTRWLVDFFNIGPFVTMKISSIAKILLNLDQTFLPLTK